MTNILSGIILALLLLQGIGGNGGIGGNAGIGGGVNSGGGPTYSVTSYTINSTNPYTTASINTTGAQFVAFYIAFLSSEPYTITDNKGNGSATALLAFPNTGSQGASQWQYYATPTVGTGHTFTFTAGGTSYSQAVIYVVKGVTGVYDSQYAGADGLSGATCQPTVAINPGSGTHLVLTGATDVGSGTQTVDSGFTLDVHLNSSGGAVFGAATGSLIQNPGASVQPTWSGLIPGGTNGSCTVMSLH